MYIVQGEQAESQDLVRYKKMADVCPAEPGTGGAVAGLVERAPVVAVFCALDVDASRRSECRAIAAHACWSDAVEQIDSSPNSFDDVLGESNSHEVAWLVSSEG